MARSRPLARWGFAALLCSAPLALMPSEASAAASLVAGQQVIGSNAATISLSVSLAANPTAGNVLIMIGANWNGALLAPNATPTPGVTGGGVTSWSRATVSATNSNIEIWYGVVDTTPSKTVTATQCNTPCASGGMRMSVSEWTGLIGTQSQLLDQTSSGSGPSSPASAPPITTTNANDLLVFGAAMGSGTFGTPSLGGTPGPWSAMTGITTPAVQSSWYQNVSSTYTNLTITSTLTSGTAWDAAIAAFKACSVTDASYVVARGQNGQVTVYWSSPNWVTVLRKTSANGVFTTETPTAPGTATTQYSGAAGSLTESVANGTWYYKVFTKCGATYSAGIAITPVPATTSLWSYSTAAATLAPPGIDDNNVVIWGGNDNKVHGADANTGVMKFPVFTQPTGALQARPPIIPAAYSQTGVNVAYATSQDGNVYAINTATGAQLWKKSLTAANKLQGGAAVWLQSIQSLPICGATTDAVFVGTRDTATTTGNIIYALNAGTSQATTTAAGGTCVAGTVNPGDVLWTFTGNATFKLDAIVSTPYVDYTTYAGNKYALWVTSNAASGLLQPSLWKLNVQNGTLFSGNTTSCTTPATSCWLLGHTDASPSPSGDGSWMYVGTNCIGSSCATQAATFNAVEISSGSVKTHNPGTGGFNGTGNIRGPYPLTSAPFGTQGTIAYVNSKSTAQSTASTSCVVDMASASPSGGLTAGNTNIVIVAVPVAAEKVWNITDSRGSIYSRRNYFFAAGLVVEIWSGVVAAGNGATVTVSFNAYSTTSVCAVAQYSGVGAVVSKPSFNNATGSGTTATVATFAPTQDTNNWAVAGFAYVANSAFTSGTGNLRTSATFASVGAALTDNSSASKATVTNAVNHSATGTWVATVVELRSVTVDHVIFTRDATVHGMQFAGNASGTSSTTFNRSYDVSPGFVSAVVDDGGGRMYVGQTNGKLLQMDAWAGSGVWWDTNLHPSPQIAGTSVTLGDPSYDGVLSRIYVGGNDGRVYAVTVPW